MRSTTRRAAVAAVLTLVLAMVCGAPADAASGFAEAYGRADGFLSQGAYARARTALQNALDGKLTAEEAKEGRELLRRVDDALADHYDAVMRARASAAASAEERKAEASRRLARHREMLAEADRLSQAAARGDAEQDLAAARLRVKVASERANAALDQAIAYFEQGECDPAKRILERLREWIAQQRSGDVPARADMGASRERLVARYLAKVDDAKLNMSAAKKVREEREARRRAREAALAKRREVERTCEEAATALKEGRLEEARGLFNEVLASGVSLGSRKDKKVGDNLARIEKELAAIKPRRDAAIVNMDTGERLLKKGEWRSAKRFLVQAVDEQEVLPSDQRVRLAGLMAEVKKAEATAAAAAEAALRQSQITAESKRKADAYIEEIRRQRRILEDEGKTTADQYYLMAKKEYVSGDLDAALEHAEQALKYWPDHAGALELKAKIRVLQGEEPDAAGYTRIVSDEYKVRMKQARSEMDLAIQRGRVAYDKKEYAKAVAHFTEAAEVLDFLRPDYDVSRVESQVQGWLKRAKEAEADARRRLAEQREFEAALKIEEAARAERDRRQRQQLAVFTQANAEFGRGKYKSAIALANKVLDKDPYNTAAQELIKNAREMIKRRTWKEVYAFDKRARQDERLKLREKLVWPGATTQYPAKDVWEEISGRMERRREMAVPEREKTPEEKTLDEALDKEFPGISLPEMTLREAIEYLKALPEAADLDFQIDMNLEESPDDILVSIDRKNITIRKALQTMLARHRLDFCVSPVGYIFISNEQGCLQELAQESELVVQTYDVRDILNQPAMTGGGRGGDSGDDDDDYSGDGDTGGGRGGEGGDQFMDVIAAFYPRSSYHWNVFGRISGGGDDDDDGGGGGFGDLMGGEGEVGEGAGGASGRRICMLFGGSLIVRHTPDVHKQLFDTLQLLRKASGVDIQIEVEARLITFTDNFFKDIGIDWRDINFTTSAIPSKPSEQVHLHFPKASWTFDLRPVSFVPAMAGSGVLSLAASFLDFGDAQMIVHAAKSSSHATVVASPHVIARNGEWQNLEMSSQSTYVSGFSVQDGIAIPDIDVYESDSAKIDVRATAMPDLRYVLLEVTPEITVGTLVTQEIVVPIRPAEGGSPGGVTTEIGLPVETVSSIESNVIVPDRGTLVLGGLSRLAESKGQGSIPLLCHIPILKRLVIRSTTSKERRHVIFLVTPTIILRDEIEP